MVKRLLACCAAVLLAIVGAGAVTDTMTGIFDEHFRTLQTSVNGDVLSYPVIMLGSNDRLTVSFDELAEDNSYLRYRVVHCNANWQPSQLVESEVVDGFNFGNVDAWSYSRATTVHYVHYQITLPNADMNFLVSGNYLLQVYNEDDPDEPVLQVRFMISEQTAIVDADVLSVTDIDYNRNHQQVSVTVDTTNARVENPFNDLIVYVSQNGRWDNEVALAQPLRVSGKTAFYEHLRPLIFKAGNEYRRFENVSTTYLGRNVLALDYHDPYYHATLLPDTSRADDPYLYDSTQHGRFVVREYNSDRSDIDADYIVTHFALEIPEIPGANIFIDGDMVGRRFGPESMMIYNRASGRYEKNLLLKQGAYNYQYLVVGPGDRSGATAPIEGDFYQTANEYLVKVYTRHRGERYDRLIGYTVIRF